MIKIILKILFKVSITFFLLSIIPIIIFKFLPPPTSSFMIQNKLKNLIDDKPSIIYYDWVRKDNISTQLKLAVIGAEDQIFFEHWGFDFRSISEAFKINQRKRIQRGASTITQQVSKNLFLWPQKSFIRKGLEAYFTLLIELIWSKDRILEVYLNIAQFGENVFGAEAASKKYFKKNAKNLNHYEASLMAAVLPNPLRFKINAPTTYVINRSKWIRKQMYQLGESILKNH